MLDQWFAQIFFFTSMHLRKKCEECCVLQDECWQFSVVIGLMRVNLGCLVCNSCRKEKYRAFFGHSEFKCVKLDYTPNQPKPNQPGPNQPCQISPNPNQPKPKLAFAQISPNPNQPKTQISPRPKLAQNPNQPRTHTSPRPKLAPKSNAWL